MRLVTYNIRGGLGLDGRRSLERVADVLLATGADVICLQEVHRHLPQSLFADQPAELERLLQRRVVFHPVSRLGIGRFGNATATELPVQSIRMHRLNNDRERERLTMRWENRGLLDAVIETGLGSVVVMTTHWSLNAIDRLVSASTVAEIAAGCDLPVVLCGDLNAGPGSLELRALEEVGRLQDAGADAGEPTFPSSIPTSRIDFVWHSAALPKPRCTVLDTQASDHRPLLAEW